MAASQPSRSQQVQPAPTRQYLASALLLLPIAAAFFVPSAFPALILLPLVGVLLILPSIDEHGLWGASAFSWLATVAALVVAWWRLPATEPAQTLGVMLALLALVSAALLLVWHWGHGYTHLTAVQGALPVLEREVDERWTALQRLLRDIEVRAAMQKELLAEVKQRTHELGLLNQIGDIFRTSRTVPEAEQMIATLVQQLFEGQGGALSLRTSEPGHLRTVVTWGEVSVAEEFEEEACWALQTGQEYLVLAGEPEAKALCQHLRHTGSSEYLCVPLKAQGHTLGILHLRPPRQGTLSPDTLRLANMTAEQIALVLTNLHLRDSLHLQSVRDPLTGLYNRRYMEESLKREVRRVTRSEQPLGIIMIDVDNLREFNGTIGYDVGDEFLRQLGIFLQSNIRGADIACRYYGDQFVVIMPEAPLEITHKRAEYLREAVHRLEVQQQRAPAEQLTLSFGIAHFPENGANADALLYAARSALARAKAVGGNRVLVA